MYALRGSSLVMEIFDGVLGHVGRAFIKNFQEGAPGGE